MHWGFLRGDITRVTALNCHDETRCDAKDDGIYSDDQWADFVQHGADEDVEEHSGNDQHNPKTGICAPVHLWPAHDATIATADVVVIALVELMIWQCGVVNIVGVLRRVCGGVHVDVLCTLIGRTRVVQGVIMDQVVGVA